MKFPSTSSLLLLSLSLLPSTGTLAFQPPSSLPHRTAATTTPSSSSLWRKTASTTTKSSFHQILASPPFLTTTSRLYATGTDTLPETLATQGDWSAYLDDESTGLVYYFNGKTGESRWEPPTKDFPVVVLPRSVRRQAEAKRMAYIKAVEQQQREAASSSSSSGGGGAGNLFSDLFDSFTGAAATTDKDDAMVAQESKTRWFDFLFDFDTQPAEESEVDAAKEREQAQQQAAQAQEEREKSWLDSFFPDQQEEEAAARVDTTSSSKEQDGGWFGGIFASTSDVNGDTSTIERTSDAPPVEKEEGGGFFDSFLSPGGGATAEPVSEKPAVVEPAVEEKKEVQRSPTLSIFSSPTLSIPKTEEKVEIEKKETGVPPPIEIDMASYVMPHPNKVFWGGEDAVFTKGNTFGVFDGVSGASKLDGVPLYSKTLAAEMKKQIKSPTKTDDEGLNVRQLTDTLTLARTVADETSTGASTAIVGSITKDGYLRVLNLGDSACIVIRNGKVAAKSREISHYFDCPYQLSTDSPDIPRDGTKLNIELQRGDVIVMGSDGIFDNLYETDIVEIVANSPLYTHNGEDTSTAVISKQNRKRWLPALAKQISGTSRKVSLNKRVPTPYAVQSKKNGDPDYADGLGGKLDDISCVVVRYS